MKNNNVQIFAIVALAIALVIMSVGFAGMSSDLKINGAVKLGATSWDIHFDGGTFTESGATASSKTLAATEGSTGTAIASSVTGTYMSYEVKLAKPGDYYEFTIDVVNAGSFDANLASISLTNSDPTHVAYTFTYEGQSPISCNSDSCPATSVSGVTLTKAGGTNSSDTVTVRAEYLVPTEDSELVTTDDTSVTLTANLHYDQVLETTD